MPLSYLKPRTYFSTVKFFILISISLLLKTLLTFIGYFMALSARRVTIYTQMETKLVIIRHCKKSRVNMEFLE